MGKRRAKEFGAPTTVLVPIPSLTVPSAWPVGRVVLHPFERIPPVTRSINESFNSALDVELASITMGSVAVVPDVMSIDEALGDLAGQAEIC